MTSKKAGRWAGGGAVSASISTTVQAATIEARKRIAERLKKQTEQAQHLGPRPQPITTAEARQWFTDHIRNPKHVPPEAQLAPFVERMNRDLDFNWRTGPARTAGLEWLPSLRDFSAMAHEMRADLDYFAVLGEGFWPGFGVADATISKLREALAELGDFARARAKTGRKRTEWHAHAAEYSDCILEALLATGWTDVALTKLGPVASIGATAVARVLGGKKIDAETFSAGVKARQNRLADLRRQTRLRRQMEKE